MKPAKTTADKHVGRKPPELIKKGLQCRVLACSEKCDHRCHMCDFYVPNYNLEDRYADALSYIQELLEYTEQLETRLAQVERERDAALHDFLREPCEVCKRGETALDDCRAPYTQCKFEWRGVYPENTKEHNS